MLRILALCTASALLSLNSYSQIKKPSPRKPAVITKQTVHVSEEQAKKVHNEQLARTAGTKFRSAYKRSDFETHQQETDKATAQSSAATTDKSQQLNSTDTKTATAANKKKEPKFIDGFVLERN